MPASLRATLTAGLLAAVLAGCTAGSGPEGPDVPPEDAFAEGTCRTAAPDVRAVGEAIPQLGDGGGVEGDVKASLREAQDRLRALADGAETELQAPFAELIEKIGIVRIRSDGNTYEPQFGERLTAAYEGVLDVCT